MPLVFYQGKMLFAPGGLAMDLNCCCDDNCCTKLPDVLYGRYTNHCDAVDLVFSATDGAGNKIADCEEGFWCSVAPFIAMDVRKCWSSGTVEITCGQNSDVEGQAGLCNSTRSGKFIVLCGSCPLDTGYMLRVQAVGFCLPEETSGICFGFEGCDDPINNTCAALLEGLITTFFTEGFPCLGCFDLDGCTCEKFEIWK